MSDAASRRSPGQSPAFPGAVTAGGLVFTSGLVSPAVVTADSRSLSEQTADVLEALAATLARHGCTLPDVVSLTAYLDPGADPAVWDAAWTAAFPVDPPARTTVTCGFVRPGIRIEVSAVALAPSAVP